MVETAAHTLIRDADPAPVEVVHANSTSKVLLLCEHAGRAVPASLDLGVSHDVLNSHRGWDIGAEDVARGVADALSAPLIIQRYSRLVIDCNRPPGNAQSIPVVSDGVAIPGNQGPNNAVSEARVREIFAPMDQRIADLFDTRHRKAAFSIHSFTPRMDGVERPMHAGFLTRTSADTAHALMRQIAADRPDIPMALNAPYQIDDDTDWFIPKHAEPRAIPHCLIEIRNDQIDHPEGVALWSGLVSRAIATFMESLT